MAKIKPKDKLKLSILNDIKAILKYNWEKESDDFIRHLDEYGDEYDLTYNQIDEAIVDFQLGKNVEPFLRIAAKSQHVFGSMARIQLWIDGIDNGINNGINNGIDS